jgi:hypothetical protein
MSGWGDVSEVNSVECPYPTSDKDPLFYKQFVCPTAICITGTTNSGKTYFLRQLLKEKERMFRPPPSKVMYCYGVWQDLFHEMETKLGVDFHEGLPDKQSVDSFADV